MKEKPILFSGEMVRAILDGRKTQTRRVIKPQPEVRRTSGRGTPHALIAISKCPYGQPGDRLWVRETWAPVRLYYDWDTGYCDGMEDSENLEEVKRQHLSGWEKPSHCVCYKSTGDFEDDFEDRGFHWRPSIHMPRWASRITLEVTNVRVERLQDISEEDAKAEGVTPFTNVGADQRIACDDKDRTQGSHPYTLAFACLWDSINSKRGFGWSNNPWLWVVEFKRISP